MKKSFENQYLSFLKDVFNEKKSHAIFFSPDSGEPYELDVLKMSVDIQKLDPGLINVVIEKGIKMRDLSNSSMQNLLKELAQDEKGAVVCWNDKTVTKFTSQMPVSTRIQATRASFSSIINSPNSPLKPSSKRFSMAFSKTMSKIFTTNNA
ncbi:MAG: hypothetical protein LBC77_04485 [Spirochaetaceae bacterium]|jgi:hypothetical protein|nr:hypothetical protein [Spirochaetaceae bacterium]